MSYGEHIQPNHELPLSPEGVLSDDFTSPEPMLPEGANPVVAADLHVAVMGDLASVQALRSELSAWLQERYVRHLGASAITKGEVVALSFKRIDTDGTLAERPPSPEEEDFQRRLDTTIYDTLVRQGEDPATRRFQGTTRRFAEDGIYTFRDLLVMGKKRSRGSHASSTFAPIRQAVIGALPEEADAWKANPDAAQAARICPTLASVTAGAVLDYHELHSRWSVQDVLTRSAEELIAMLWGEPHKVGKPSTLEAAHDLQARARVYARDFLAAQQASQQRS
jgi:hypothetical protein